MGTSGIYNGRYLNILTYDFRPLSVQLRCRANIFLLNGHFFNFFLGKISQENVFYGILERKNAFLGYKNNKFKKSKNWHFPTGVNPCFGSKNGHFSNIFLGNIGQENVFYDILKRNKMLRSVHFGAVVVELIKWKCGGIVRNEIW